jgi:RNA polymerase sigma factor (TIGR02999 family)
MTGHTAPLPTETSASRHVTDLLVAWSGGNEDALTQLIPLVYTELRRLAHHQMRHERVGHTLQTTAVVNEAYMRLVDLARVRWQDRAHFFAMSARLMRRILVDHARGRKQLKRGGDPQRVTLEEHMLVTGTHNTDLVALDDALQTLAKMDERKSQVVEMRIFGGLTVEETAEALHISPETVMRDWKMAKVWLRRELDGRG